MSTRTAVPTPPCSNERAGVRRVQETPFRQDAFRGKAVRSFLSAVSRNLGKEPFDLSRNRQSGMLRASGQGPTNFLAHAYKLAN